MWIIKNRKDDIYIYGMGSGKEGRESYICIQVIYYEVLVKILFLNAICSGIYELVPQVYVSKFSAEELKQLVNGKPIVNPQEIREGTRYTGGYEKGKHNTIEMFWKAMKSFKNETREDVMRFVTGTAKVPLDGFDPAFTITRAEGADEETLPTSHTCFNQLVLPEYRSVEKLIEKLMYAVKHGHGFHLS